MIKALLKKRSFDIDSDRLGPDCPFTHWRLYFKPSMLAICNAKFKYFGVNADFRAGAYAICCSKISLGNNVVIRPNTMIFAAPNDNDAGSVLIEDDVMIGSGVHIYAINHRYDLSGINIINQGHSDAKTVTLMEGCWLGANVVVLPGVTIGKNSVVGAGSIVTKDVPDRVVVAGNPATLIKNLI